VETTLTEPDSFADIARHYDGIMEHVDYDRWFRVVTELAKLLPSGFRHLDAACGTGTLLKMLRRAGWDSLGMDLSHAMLRAAREDPHAPPAATADLRALPFRGCFDYVTCLFDSMNFLTEIGDIRRALEAFHEALTPGGILYFDVVTERMVLDYYEGETWVESNGKFTTTWENRYDWKTRVITCDIRINTGASCALVERIYPRAQLERAVTDAGFGLLAVRDAHTWKAPNKKTVRIDFVATKGNPRPLRKSMRAIGATLRERGL